MNINTLYSSVRLGEPQAEEKLFAYLTVRFRLFAKQKISDEAEAEEIVQDALMTIVDKYKALEIEDSFAAWAYRVLNYKLMVHVKTKSTRAGILSRASDAMRERAVRHIDPTLEMRLLNCLKKIDKVHNRHARILNLHYQGYTTGEICERLKITPNNFYVILSRARSMLEFCLEKGDIE